jgi:hypothetical protein
MRSYGVAVIALAAAAATSGAQATADTASPAIGAMAPDFSLAGATRYGLLKGPVHLADYRGQTVVLAFFYQARTKG